MPVILALREAESRGSLEARRLLQQEFNGNLGNKVRLHLYKKFLKINQMVAHPFGPSYTGG